MPFLSSIRDLAARNRRLLANFSYISALEAVVLLVPLLVYPYLVRVLGQEVYGLVITAQVLAGYCSIAVDFGFRTVGARSVAVYRDSPRVLSELLSAVCGVRLLVWFVALGAYIGLVRLVPEYRAHTELFLCAYTLTFNELLFPQFFFQGMENMRGVAIMNIAVRLVSVVLLFVLIHAPSDYVYAPLLMGIGYLLAGVASLWYIGYRYGVRLHWPRRRYIRYMLHDALPILGTDAICSVKDKFNYLLIGSWVSMEWVVVYDLGARFTSLLVKPAGVVGTVLFPRLAATQSLSLFRRGGVAVVGFTLLGTVALFVLLPWIAPLFIPGLSSLLELRIYMVAPLLLSISGYLASEFLIAFRYARYLLWSIMVTTVGYLVGLLVGIGVGVHHSVLFFVLLCVGSYLVELIYRVYVYQKKTKALWA